LVYVEACKVIFYTQYATVINIENPSIWTSSYCKVAFRDILHAIKYIVYCTETLCVQIYIYIYIRNAVVYIGTRRVTFYMEYLYFHRKVDSNIESPSIL
jgi:hypothetical protein